MQKTFDEIKKAEKINNRIIKTIGLTIGFSFLILVLGLIRNL